MVGTGQVGDGAGHLEDAAVGTCRQRQPFHGGAQQFETGIVGLGILVYHALGHLGVAVDVSVVFEPLGLPRTCGDDPFADEAAGLAGCCTADVFEGQRCNLYLQVYSV